MSAPIIVHKGRTNILLVNLDYDVSLDTITSEIRAGEDADATLIAAWTVEYVNDGADGKLRLSLDDSITNEILYTNGYMDAKRVSGGEPFQVFDKPIHVVFKEAITA